MARWREATAEAVAVRRRWWSAVDEVSRGQRCSIEVLAATNDEAMSCPRTWSGVFPKHDASLHLARSMASIEDRWSGLGQSSRSPRFQRPDVFRVSGAHSRHTHPCAVSSKHPSLLTGRLSLE